MRKTDGVSDLQAEQGCSGSEQGGLKQRGILQGAALKAQKFEKSFGLIEGD